MKKTGLAVYGRKVEMIKKWEFGVGGIGQRVWKMEEEAKKAGVCSREG